MNDQAPSPTGNPAAPSRGIIIGHTNMDLDCLGSLVLARHLHPGHLLVKSSRISPMARHLFHMFQDQLALVGSNEIDYAAVESVVIVDTRSQHQVREVLDHFGDFQGRITVYDHHPSPPEGEGLAFGHPERIESHHEALGANVSLLCGILQARGIAISPDEATVALAGIYADTGNFCHENLSPKDFLAARWLLEQGASLALVRKFAASSYDKELSRIMHDLMVALESHQIQGRLVQLAQLDLDGQVAGLAMVVERLFELEQSDALFCVFRLRKEKSQLIIARSHGHAVDVGFLLAAFGGGGHSQSASALIKQSLDVPVYEHLKRSLELRLQPGLSARQLMSASPFCLGEQMSLLDAALALENAGHSGAPVLDAASRVVGMLSFKDIQKGRKSGRLNTPVKAWMSHQPRCISPDTSLREIETIFFQTEFNRLPVVQGEQLVGLVCRSDYLALLRGDLAPRA